MKTPPENISHAENPPKVGLNDSFAIDGSLKKSWESFLDDLAALSDAELSDRQLKASKILYEDGAGYNNYRNKQLGISTQSQSQKQGSLKSQSQSQSQNRFDTHKTDPWSLDLLPNIIEADDWQTLEEGLQERAELFNLIFSDLYGKRELISKGIIPPEAVFGNNRFIRECNDIRLQGEHQLIVHAMDVVRRENGDVCVLTDRVQAPSGFGYTLENRIVMNRVMPSFFNGHNVVRLANFFQEFRNKLIDLASNVSSPRIVMLTPGLYNETYFEHAFLANYLGFSLVQGNDLVVKDGFVWIRSVEGLSKVDVIIRRVDDDYCDPVELRPDSQLGVPGLLQVARAGNVCVVNPFGSGIMESPVLLAYMPEIANYLLGREPILKSVSTWWCYEPDHLDYVKKMFKGLVIKKVNPSHKDQTIIVSSLNEKEQTELMLAIETTPADYVAQEKLIPSQIPALINNELVNRSMVFRGFAVAGEGQSYNVMPGGMSRVNSNQTETHVVSNRLGTISKDTWVLSQSDETASAMVSKSHLNVGFTQGVLLPSRVIENLFWMSRYTERAEHNLRLLRTISIILNGINVVPKRVKVVLLESITKSTSTYPGFIDNEALIENPNVELLSVILDQHRFGSISQSITSLTHDTNQLKGSLSTDVVKVMNDIDETFQKLRVHLELGNDESLTEQLNPLIASLLALSGIAHETMFRDSGWHFLELGRRMERVMQTANLIRSLLFVKLSEPNEILILEAIGLSTDSLVPYQRINGNALKVESMIEILLRNESNPRSLYFQLRQICNSIEQLPEHEKGMVSRELVLIKEALSLVNNADLHQFTASSNSDVGVRKELDQFCSRINYLMSEVSQELSDKYFLSAEKTQMFN